MLDFGFMEILLICVIALVVLGPEKLPRLVRTLSLIHISEPTRRYAIGDAGLGV